MWKHIFYIKIIIYICILLVIVFPKKKSYSSHCLDFRSDSGITSPFTPRSGSGTPSLPDEGEFPCTQCDKRFGNRRNLMSHMRRHTGKLIFYLGKKYRIRHFSRLNT